MIPAVIGYREVDRGLTDVIVPFETRPSDAEREVIFAAVTKWIAGKIEPFRTVDVGNKNAKNRVVVERIEHRNADNPQMIVWKSKEVPLAMAHVESAKLYYRNDENLDYDPVTGKPVAPWIHVVCNDGSQADFLLPDDLVDKEAEAPVKKTGGKKTS